MTRLAQVADFLGGEKRARADQSCDDEEMSLPPATGERVGDPHGALATVIESEEHVPVRARQIGVRDPFGRTRARGDGREVARERVARVLVRERPGALEAGGRRVIRHLVIPEARGDHGAGRHRDRGTDATRWAGRRRPTRRSTTPTMEPRPYERCSTGNTASRARALRTPCLRTDLTALASAAAP